MTPSGTDPRAARSGLTDAERQLILTIARCPVVDACVRGGEANPCAGVVRWQGAGDGPRWPPEPWSGHLGEAPILFLSSNPSAADEGVRPGPLEVTATSSDDRIIGLFDGAFDAGGPHIQDGIRWVDGEGTVSPYVRYWASIKARAAELLGHAPVPGVDYALSEVVHCGTRHEAAVWEARTQCVELYLRRVLDISPACVVVLFGAHVAAALASVLPGGAPYGLHGPLTLADRDRWLVKLPHPNSRGTSKRVAAWLTPSQLAVLREALGSPAPR